MFNMFRDIRDSAPSKQLLRRAIDIHGNQTMLIVIFVLGGLIILTAILWILLAFRYRRQKRAQNGEEQSSKKQYRKLQKRPLSKASEKSSMDESSVPETVSDSITHYVGQGHADIESQPHDRDAESIYEDDTAYNSFSPSRLLPRMSIRKPQPSASNNPSLGRYASIRSNYSYDRHVSEYTALVSPELERFIDEPQYPTHPSTQSQQYSNSYSESDRYTREELIDFAAQERQMQMAQNSLSESSESCYQRQRSRSLTQKTITDSSAPLLQESDLINGYVYSQPQPQPQPQAALAPPLPRKSSRRSSVPTSIDERIVAPALILTCPSTSTLDLSEVNGANWPNGQRGRSLSREPGMLNVGRRFSRRRSVR